MSRTDVSAPTLGTPFWDRFTSINHDQGIKEPYNRWLVLRAEQYVKALSPAKLFTDRYKGGQKQSVARRTVGREADSSESRAFAIPR